MQYIYRILQLKKGPRNFPFRVLTPDRSLVIYGAPREHSLETYEIGKF